MKKVTINKDTNVVSYPVVNNPFTSGYQLKGCIFDGRFVPFGLAKTDSENLRMLLYKYEAQHGHLPDVQSELGERVKTDLAINKEYELESTDIKFIEDVDVDVETESIVFPTETWFDVDKYFGVKTIDNPSVWINLYIEYFPKTNKAIGFAYWSDEVYDNFEIPCPLTENEQKEIILLIKEFCKSNFNMTPIQMLEETIKAEKESEIVEEKNKLEEFKELLNHPFFHLLNEAIEYGLLNTNIAGKLKAVTDDGKPILVDKLQALKEWESIPDFVKGLSSTIDIFKVIEEKTKMYSDKDIVLMAVEKGIIKTESDGKVKYSCNNQTKIIPVSEFAEFFLKHCNKTHAIYLRAITCDLPEKDLISSL